MKREQFSAKAEQVEERLGLKQVHKDRHSDGYRRTIEQYK